VCCERPLCRYRAGDRFVRPRKGIEEGVALRVDFTTAVLRECGAEQASVFGQGFWIALAEDLEETRGSLDVRTKEADRPRR
jgi:hypothetical protein